MPPSISPSLPPPFLWIINQSLSPGDSVAHQDTFQCCASCKLFSFFLHRQTIFLLSPITWVTGSSLFKGKAYLTVFSALFVLNSPAHKCSSDKKKKKHASMPRLIRLIFFVLFFWLVAAPHSKIQSEPVLETAGTGTATKRIVIRTLIKAPAVTCLPRKRSRWRPLASSLNHLSRVSPSTSGTSL